MKKLFILIATALLFACNNEGEDKVTIPNGCDTTGLQAAIDSCEQANIGNPNAHSCWTQENINEWCRTHHH